MRRHSNASVLLVGSLLTLTPMLGGCTVLQSLGLSPKTDRADVAEVGPLPNATCEAHWASTPTPPLADPDAPAELAVMDSLCWPLVREDPRAGAMDARATRRKLGARDRHYVQAHFAFDDRHPDPMRAALIVTGCVDHGTCESKRSYVVGQIASYAELATPEAVERELAGLELPDTVRKAYQEHYVEARTQVLEMADAMPDKDVEVCRTIPQQVRARRADEYETFAEYYTRFDALQPRLSGVMRGESGDAALLAEAVTLRDEQVRACFDRSALDPLDCWHATVARPLTEAIARMAVRQGDAARARVEHETLESAPDQFTTGNEISYAQMRAMKGSSSAPYTAWDFIPSFPRDPELAKEVAELSKDLEWVKAEVDRVEVAGGQATIHLLTKVTKKTANICKETNKVDRIDNGKVIYKKKCRAGKTTTTRTPYAPVVVPAADVRGLEHGQLVSVVVEPKSRRGHLVEGLATTASFGGKRARLRLRGTPLSRG
ncbi:MAG: hypothetical protein AB1Z98_01955 [Nannocystaceae bacterium]